ncbi:hypothetical protein GCM10011613_29150 [Cellvibrio zantedeschiae]|uniref:General secretion pathway protein GspM n=1 Tax=Cellvibrio zantedeschiae TaxID=1237077 RepID=A0ABQ3B7X1_9GAMM|nr:hypothetical protein [Cellvibrio zantedeschiae]GGY82514.1 hypothetical protein GCM10011613_29150 [Cellvibrio zantedeschiae]
MLNNLRAQLIPYWLQFQDQLQANQRLRWMMWGIAYIFVFYFSLVLNDWRQEQNNSVAQLQRTSTKLDQLKHQTQWPERWQQEKAVGEKLRGKLWETQSESLAEADLQNYLRKLMNDHNGQNYRPRLAPTERITIAGETMIKVAAEVTGAVASTQIDHFMKAMADNPKSLEVERFSYSPQRSGQLNMQVAAYFLIVEAPAADASTQEAANAP